MTEYAPDTAQAIEPVSSHNQDVLSGIVISLEKKPFRIALPIEKATDYKPEEKLPDKPEEKKPYIVKTEKQEPKTEYKPKSGYASKDKGTPKTAKGRKSREKAGKDTLTSIIDEEQETLSLEEGNLFDSPDELVKEEEEIDYNDEDVALKLYLNEMDRYPLLTQEREIELSRGMHDISGKVAETMFKQKAFFSNYLGMLFNPPGCSESLRELMPERDYTSTKNYLAALIKNAQGGKNPKEDGEVKKITMKFFAELRYDGKNLERIYQDIVHAEREISSARHNRNKDPALKALGFNSMDSLKDFLSAVRPYYEQYRSFFDIFFNSNLKLVVKIANKHRNKHMLLLDIIQEGNMGLMRAVEKFDYRKGYKFSSYATWWIHQAAIRATADKSRDIRVPIYINETIKKMKKIADEFQAEEGREMLPEEIAAKLGVSVDKVAELIRASHRPVSLHGPVQGMDETEMIDLVPDMNTPRPEDVAIEKSLHETIEYLLETLKPREEKIMRLRHGIGEDQDYTLEEVGEMFKLSRERIRQIEKKAIIKLRHPSKSRYLRHYHDKDAVPSRLPANNDIPRKIPSYSPQDYQTPSLPVRKMQPRETYLQEDNGAQKGVWLTISEMAELMGCSKNSVNPYIKKARGTTSNMKSRKTPYDYDKGSRSVQYLINMANVGYFSQKKGNSLLEGILRKIERDGPGEFQDSSGKENPQGDKGIEHKMADEKSQDSMEDDLKLTLADCTPEELDQICRRPNGVLPEHWSQIVLSKRGDGATAYANIDIAVSTLKTRHHIYTTNVKLKEIMDMYRLTVKANGNKEVLLDKTLEMAVKAGIISRKKD